MRLILLSAVVKNSLFVGTSLFTYYVLFVVMADPVGLGLAFSVGYFSSAVCSLIGGSLADRVGRKTVVVSGFLVSAFAWLSLAWITDVSAVFIIYGIVMGATSGLYSAYAALISDIVRGENIGGALGLVNTVTSLSGAIGALVAGYVVSAFSYGILYILVFLLTTVSLIPLLILQVDETREKRGSARALPSLAPIFRNRDLSAICFAVFVITLGTFASLFYPAYVKEAFGAGRFEVAVYDSIYLAI